VRSARPSGRAEALRWDAMERRRVLLQRYRLRLFSRVDSK